MGAYLDEKNVLHGFLRNRFGKFTTFNCPGAGASNYQAESESVNAAGLISADYLDVNGVWQGCLRARDGTFTTFDPPDAGTVPGSFQGTNAAEFMPAFGGINPAGTITGFYADANSVYHGYIRTARGTFVTFDVPRAGTGNWQGTLPLNINPKVAITGWYIDESGVYHGFLRNP